VNARAAFFGAHGTRSINLASYFHKTGACPEVVFPLP